MGMQDDVQKAQIIMPDPYVCSANGHDFFKVFIFIPVNEHPVLHSSQVYRIVTQQIHQPSRAHHDTCTPQSPSPI